MPVLRGTFYVQHGVPGRGSLPAILIHGAGGTHLHWPPQVRRLRRRSIFALDLPGHGRSAGSGRDTVAAYADTVLAFMDSAGLEAATLIGHSMGSAIALTCALEHASRVRSVALLGAAAKLTVSPRLSSALAAPEAFPEAVELVVRYSYSVNASPRLKELAAARLAATDPTVLRRDFSACDRFDATDRLGELHLPTLILAAAEDRMTPAEHSQFLHDRIAGARIQVIEGAGHMVMLEQPAAVALALDQFLEETAQGEGASSPVVATQ